MSANFNLLFSLPDVLIAEVFSFDTTYRIFGSDEFKKELHYGSLLKQTAYAREKVTELINIYFDAEEEEYIYKNEYCFIGGPSGNLGSPYEYGARAHIKKYDPFFVYVAPPMDNILYYKILPTHFINKPTEFFHNIRYDGFFSHTNYTFNYDNIFTRLYNTSCTTFHHHFYITHDGQHTAPFMYSDLDLWI